MTDKIIRYEKYGRHVANAGELTLGAIAAVMTGLGVGASALADYVYGPNTK